MKERRTGVMVSFTLGMAAGLYATSEDVRHFIQERIKKPQRDIIEASAEMFEVVQGSSRFERFTRKIRNRYSIHSRNRIIRKNKRK